MYYKGRNHPHLTTTKKAPLVLSSNSKCFPNRGLSTARPAAVPIPCFNHLPLRFCKKSIQCSVFLCPGRVGRRMETVHLCLHAVEVFATNLHVGVRGSLRCHSSGAVQIIYVFEQSPSLPWDSQCKLDCLCNPGIYCLCPLRDGITSASHCVQL